MTTMEKNDKNQVCLGLFSLVFFHTKLFFYRRDKKVSVKNEKSCKLATDHILNVFIPISFTKERHRLTQDWQVVKSFWGNLWNVVICKIKSNKFDEKKGTKFLSLDKSVLTHVHGHCFCSFFFGSRL